jgi:hypothetical protein
MGRNQSSNIHNTHPCRLNVIQISTWMWADDLLILSYSFAVHNVHSEIWYLDSTWIRFKVSLNRLIFIIDCFHRAISLPVIQAMRFIWSSDPIKGINNLIGRVSPADFFDHLLRFSMKTLVRCIYTSLPSFCVPIGAANWGDIFARIEVCVAESSVTARHIKCGGSRPRTALSNT